VTLSAAAARAGSRYPSTAGYHAAPGAIDEYLLPAPDLSSKPAARRCCCRSTGQTDGLTDSWPLRGPCTAYCAGSVNVNVNQKFLTWLE